MIEATVNLIQKGFIKADVIQALQLSNGNEIVAEAYLNGS